MTGYAKYAKAVIILEIDFKIIDLIILIVSLILLILLSIVLICIVIWCFKYLIRFLSRENITNYFSAVKVKKKKRIIYIINQRMNKQGKIEINKLRENMTDKKIRDKMVEIEQFFNKQLYILLKSLAEKNYSELLIRTHLGRKLKQAEKDGYIKNIVVKRNGVLDIIIEFILNIIGNINRKSKGCDIERKGRPLIELKKLLGKKDYKTALNCKYKSSANESCCNRCKKSSDCNHKVKSHCSEYTWKVFKTYKIKLNVENILTSDIEKYT